MEQRPVPLRWQAHLTVTATAFLSLLSIQVLAHHSYTAFDQSKRLILSGTVKELQWFNPHVWVQLMVPTTAGTLDEWGFETFAVSMLKRQGWNHSSLNPGDKVTIEYYARKDGSKGGQLLLLTMADGRVLKGYDSLYKPVGQ
jgi:hypothetical protein